MFLCIEQHKSISLIITLALSVEHDFHFIDNKTKTPPKSSNASKVMQLIRCFPSSGISTCQCGINWWEIQNLSRYEVWFLFCLGLPICKGRCGPWQSPRPLPSLTPVFTLMAPMYTCSEALSTEISITHVAVITSWQDPILAAHICICADLSTVRSQSLLKIPRLI